MSTHNLRLYGERKKKPTFQLTKVPYLELCHRCLQVNRSFSYVINALYVYYGYEILNTKATIEARLFRRGHSSFCLFFFDSGYIEQVLQD